MAKERLYYIANGYVGNAILWWGIDRKGYTTDITKAGKYTAAEAKEICKRPEDVAWPCSYILANSAALKVIVDMQYLERKYRCTWRRKKRPLKRPAIILYKGPVTKV